jgi:hypothetical protein
MCFISKIPLEIANSKDKVNKAISDLGRQTLNTKRSTTLNQILFSIDKIEQEYPTLPNHRKVIRLFELYRTLRENSLCDIIVEEEKA